MHCNDKCIDDMHVHYMEAAVAPTECKKITLRTECHVNTKKNLLKGKELLCDRSFKTFNKESELYFKRLLKAKEKKSKQVDQTLDYVLKTGFAAI